MAKSKNTIFFCQNCGYESAKWLGQCPGCREWNSFVEEPVAPKGAGGVGGGWLPGVTAGRAGTGAGRAGTGAGRT
ncbi:MAG: hypothetical protein LUC83_06165, partial [Clostridiales bacterium]|nr:hypothetical protein [Clostridiales bacterium]